VVITGHKAPSGRPSPSPRTPQEGRFWSGFGSYAGALQDTGTSADQVIQPGREPSGSARPSRTGWTADDILPALTGRVAELEAQLASIRADLVAERSRLATYAESDRSLDVALAHGYRSADAILERARDEADRALRNAVDERRTLLSEIERLREEREELHEEIASLRDGGIVEAPEATQAPSGFVLEVAIAKEMRALLVEILADFRSRAAPPPVVEIITVEPATPADVVSVPPEEVRESMVEHVDELIESAHRSQLVEHIDELRVPERA
jgi:cell division septum initiation protein DivIVA